MPTEQVRFYSHGAALAGTLMLPDGASPGRPSPPSSRGRAGWGCATPSSTGPTTTPCWRPASPSSSFDYRGFGDSEGDATYLDPHDPGRGLRERRDLPRDAARDRPAAARRVRLRRHRAAATRSWPPALDPRFKAMVAQVPIADGRDWLHRMRREHEWLEFLERLRLDRLERVATRRGRRWSPRATGSWSPRRSARPRPIKSDVDDRVPTLVALASAEAIFAYRPIDVVERIAPRAAMFICVENDCDDARGPHLRPVRAGRRARSASSSRPARRTTPPTPSTGDVVTPMIVEWFERYLVARRDHGPRGRPDAGDPVPRPARAVAEPHDATVRPRDPRRHARHRHGPDDRRPRDPTTAASPRSSRRARRSTRARTIDATGRHLLPGADRRPQPSPRAGLHPQGGHRHARRPPARPAA